MRKYQKDSTPPRSLLGFSPNKLGFTLIELLVVIVVLGVLATIVLLAVSPGEQLARARDTSRISAVTQLGRTLQNYYSLAGSYPPINSGNWMQTLVDSNDLKTKIGNQSYASTTGMTQCTAVRTQTGGGVINGTPLWGYCYNRTLADAIVYVQVESQRSKTKAGDCSTPNTTWVIFATSVAKSGLFCSATEPVPGASYTGSNFFEP